MTTAALTPTWEGVGPCVTQPDLMFNDWTAARRLCNGCPVLDQCREWVLALPYGADPGGVVAALSPTDRAVQTLDDTERECRTCYEIKPLHAFAQWTPSRQARRYDCRACVAQARRSADADALITAMEGTQ
ncbi:MAG: hypothetical protein HOV68_15485 [Streptomycetaceae bacterium]|nr:hypothetical protein [Streptomycetaceae bacterium]